MTLRLTDSQIVEVCTAAGVLGEGGDVLAGFSENAHAELRAMLSRLADTREHKLSQSFLRGLFVLAALPDDGETLGVVDLAKSLEMSPSTVHRYLLTLVMVGLARRDERTREYSRAQVAPIA